jgi:hypothetical protein
MAVLIILAIGAVVLPADTVAAMQGMGRNYGQYCTNYCQMHYREYGGLGQCLRYCNSHQQLAG